jgi:AcrR family transcriptional regulator
MSRRTPTQARAEATRRSILDATMHLLDSFEPDAIGTVQIAEAAEVPVGSIYRYFAHRDDIFGALAQELMDRVDVPLEALLRSDEPVEALVEQTVELLVLTSATAELRLIRLLRLSPHLAEIEEKSNLRIAAAVAEAFARRNPRLGSEERLAAAQVLMRGVLSGIDPIRSVEDPSLRAQFHRQTVRMAVAYARDLLEPQP